jgi:SAM-dependent methyltransferase
MGRIRQTTAAVLFHLGRSADRVARATTYLAAGTRRMADLQADLRRSWNRFYTDHPSHDSTLLQWEAEIVDTFVRPGFDVLLVGCGSGRDLVPLVEHGCRVTGIDPSEAAITIAQRLLQMRGRSALLLTGFFEDLSIAGRFETVIFSYYAYASIPMSGRRRAALAKASALLKSDGHVIVSHAAGGTRPGAVLGQLGRIAGALSRSDWRIEPGDLVWSDRSDEPSIAYTHIFEDGELEAEARAAQLRTVSCRVIDGTVIAVFARR